MPRPKRPGAPEPKRRSRTGCWQCKGRKVKCGEERPCCVNCQKAGNSCDYSIRLNWNGRRTKRASYDSKSDSPVSPNRGQRPFPIINQSFKPDADDPQPPLTPICPIKDEPWSDDQATPGYEDGSRGGLAWVPEHQTSWEYTDGPTGPAGHSANADHCPAGDQPLEAVLTNVRPAKMPQRRFSGPPQFMSLTGLPPYNPSTLEDYDTPPPAIFSPLREGFRVSRSVLSHVSVGSPLRRMSEVTATSASDDVLASLSMRFHPPHNSAMFTGPLTPATPSSLTDEEPPFSISAQAGQPSPPSPGDRRLTVESLLSEQTGSRYSGTESAIVASPNTPFPSHHSFPFVDPDGDEADFYGYDLGQVDEDKGKNNDQGAISPVPPAPLTPREQTRDFQHWGGWGSGDGLPFDFRFGDRSQRRSAGTGGYYQEPVAIMIPRSLGALPLKLRENPMNLLYFHHFLNHTARVLMPYDDLESNPFRIILPQMAVKNDHLLSLLLAYSASHRARLLQQKEPEMRMAHWVQDIFPALRSDLNDDTRIVSTTSLATAIMLASLEIISPKAFGYAIPWQEHLNLARNLMRKRFPALRQMHSSSHEDQVCSFLWSWFAYLDVLGSLSGGPRKTGSHPPLPPLPPDSGDDPDVIDCIMGFTTRCLHLLSETADLARSSDATRIRPDCTVDPHWAPPEATVLKAASLDEALRASLALQSPACAHIPSAPSGRNTLEMAATNEAFHWAALVQLHRRALGKPSSHADVEGPVRMIVGCLARIRTGTAEMGMLFPMFTAGCEVGAGGGAREEIWGRFRNVERNGMTQIRRARELMEKVWKEERPWETMLQNEFIG